MTDTRLDRAETYDGLDPIASLGGEVAGVVGRVTIQRGCDKFCTFCVVPYTRGRERGVAPREILRQARALVDGGCRGSSSWVKRSTRIVTKTIGFADLLRAVAAVDGVTRVRFTSPYPIDFSDAVIEAMAETPNICKHVHLPLQSASDSVLGRMRRGYDYAAFRALAGKLRAAMPAVAITTDILVELRETRPRRSTPPRCGRRRSCASTAPSRSPTPSAKGRRRRARCPTPSRPR